jgi:hypothetical protein
MACALATPKLFQFPCLWKGATISEGQWGGNPPAPDKYIDLSYYSKALASL